MTISQTISSLGTVPTTADPSNFDTNADAFLGTALPGFRTELNTFGTQANALAAAMNSIAAGTAQAIPYTFSTTTTDSDPGAGILRLDNATQASATAIRVDLLGSDATDYTDIIDGFDASTSTVTGQIRLIKVADATKWLVFNVTAVDSSTGYRNITVANVDSSGVDPFSDADALLLTFTRTGDKGDTGASSAGSNSVYVTTGNGWGSTNTRIRRFTTTLVNTGADITYADSAANGASFTINATGIYAMTYGDSHSAAAGWGISVNSSQLTTDVDNITAANRLLYWYLTAANDTVSGSTIALLSSGDVIRPHGYGTSSTTTAYRTYFQITRIG